MEKARILIVEDSTIVAVHLKSVLRSAQYKVIAIVPTGEDALVLLEREAPDLIMMDIILGGELDGIAASEIIRQKYNIPIIYLTALSDRLSIERAKLTAPYNYVLKPFDENDILTRVEFSLYKHALETENERVRLSNLIEGQEMERQRLSRELHDGLGQILQAIKLNMEACDEGNFQDVKQKIGGMIQEAILESKRISENLLPLKLLDFNFVTCMKSLCDQYNSPQVSVVFQTDNHHVEVSTQEKLMLYRIAQEAINNAIKHGKCTRIYVQLYSSPQEGIALTVEDNGVGFDSSAAASGHGLKNMKHRVEILSGKLQIESRRNAGTVINIFVPNKSYPNGKDQDSYSG